MWGAGVPLPPPVIELSRLQVQDRPPKQSGALGEGVRQLMSMGKPVPVPVPPPPQQAPNSADVQDGSLGLVQSHAAVDGSSAHSGLLVPPPLLEPLAHEQTPTPGLAPVPPGKPGRPPTDEACTQLEPLAELQNAEMLSHWPVVS